ncbi:haloacid dehalogenase type II [Arcticibacter eurypsychrophilus]|uniref:haloacid dehalogenase type II n=1 Tax=Arcticibacter eurypsychrophilus TaxID=1434752 RepID=UPI00084DE986|nr:haloacid dehalogenase type II [Arcticibacter eurypsychrophilus]
MRIEKLNIMSKPKIIFFDVNETLLNLETLKESIVAKLGGNKALGTLWFTSMLHYSLVATVGGQYFDFGRIGAATLLMVAKSNNIELSEDDAKATLKHILSLEAHPEVKEALAILKNAGYILVSFSNSSNKAIKEQLDFAGITTYFNHILSIEDYGKYKPHLEVYHWAARKMNIEDSDCMLVAAHGWDVSGAKWAGWQTAFVARPGQQLFPLAITPDIVEDDLLKIAIKIAN